ncbi:MAG: hypothetical protein K9M11_02960 [Candidatus Pacebacteria bacterium]|nr:hypothetical protein [Candidatus Paceibacterota bacterium]
MNSKTKISLIVVGAIVLIAILFSVNGWSLTGSKNVVDDQYSDLNSSTDGSNDSGPGVPKAAGNNTSGTSKQTSTLQSDAVLKTLIGNVALRVPQTGVDVKLNGGEADFTDSAVNGHISVGRILAKVPTESGYDVFVDMSISTKSTPSIIHYVALFRVVNQVAGYTSSVSIGDRIALTSIVATPDVSIEVRKPQSFMTSSIGYILTLTYLDRKNGEPLTTPPSLAETMSLHVKNHIVSK